MISDFLYSLKDEEMFYDISNKLEEIYKLEKEERAKLPKLERPALTTTKPNEDQINDYLKDLFKYNKELEEYKAIKGKLDNNMSWQELINTYVNKYYTSLIPTSLIQKFVFNKYKNNCYRDIFWAYIEIVDWFAENNIGIIKNNNDSSN